MRFTVLTIFPDLFQSFWEHGIIRRAILKNRIVAEVLDIRDFAEGRHRVSDDTPYGGGSGMVMKPEPLAAAIRAAQADRPESKTILLTPQGLVLNQELARDLAGFNDLVLVCGRYEGVDERICDNFIDFEISIGDYVLTGGELAAMVVMEAVSRLIPGVLGGEDSAERDSFSNDLLEHAHYTKPREFEGESVPEVLVSGHHGAIENWRQEMSLIRTFLKRRDLLENRTLSKKEVDILKKWCLDIEKIIRGESLRGIDALSGGEQGR